MPVSFKRRPLSAAILSVAASAAAGARASEAPAIEEILVTATKRAAGIQSVPVTVQAVTGTTLDQLGVSGLSDYMMQLPGVTAGGSGPGRNTVYIRGVASTTPSLSTAGVAGLAPNVAVYLDEQPLSQPGRNLDFHAADLERIEVLSGPQGTLFGASSQSGTVRLITNKPDPSEAYGRLEAEAAATRGGEPGHALEGVFNLPVNDALALRGVLYRDHQGGYIDNVRGARDVRGSARFRPEGAVRSNGVPVAASRAGFQAGADLSGVTFLEADNAALAEEDINDATYGGWRLSARLDAGGWRLDAAHARQDLDTEGVFFADPDLGDLAIERFVGETGADAIASTSWTLAGRLAALEAVYAGAFTDREVEQLIDYSDYLFVGQYLPYYICDTAVSYPGEGEPAGVCQPPVMFVDSLTGTAFETHELRFATDPDARVRAIFGAFLGDLELTERNDFAYPGALDIEGPGGRGFAPNYPFTTGWHSLPGPFPPEVVFRNDIRRTDRQLGAFGELTFDVGAGVSLTLGARRYDIEVDLEGSSNASFCNQGGEDVDAFGTDISDLYDGDGRFTFRRSCDPARHVTYSADEVDADTPPSVAGALRAPDAARAKGTIRKATLSWAPDADRLWYLTFSEGFRPGLLNRPGGITSAGGFTVPFEVETDELTNIELGWKLDLPAAGLRINGSVFHVDVSRLQTTIFDPAIVNLYFSDNAADAKIRGMEGDFVWAPPGVAGLTVAGGLSLLDTEIVRVITPTRDVRAGDRLAYAPRLQANVRARYEWSLGPGLTAHLMPRAVHSAASYSDIVAINRDRIGGWTLLGLSAGVSAGRWSAELFADNLADRRAELARDYGNDRPRTTYARPRTVGLRLSWRL